MLFSTNYFGSIPYFQAIAVYDVITIDLHERYKKQTWRNRTRILESNGPFYITVPVFRPQGNHSIIKDIEIRHDSKWEKDHWKAIESSYRHAPYFFYYGEQIKSLIYSSEKKLIDFNTNILLQILEWLDLDIKVQFTTSYLPPKDQLDYRIQLDHKKFNIPQKEYIQVFSDKFEFYPNLSILDLLMNEGPLARKYIINNDK